MKTLSVFDVVHYIKTSLDSDYRIQNILISGEVSNFNHHFSGHLYFSIKDDRAKLSCVMFKSYASKTVFMPKNGDKVIIKANISVFEGSGQMQAYVSEIRSDGLGDLFIRFEALKKKLSEEGYFAIEHKKRSPLFPEQVAVLVGDKSAALSDIKTCFARRWPICKVDIHQVLVQGEGSSNDIITKLKMVDDLGYDAIILARGGGSIEDLWSFNDEDLAKTIYNLKTFIVTGIGHEQDYTIADFVSDLRAPTPTAAVELITPNIIDVVLSIDQYVISMEKAMSALLEDVKIVLTHINDNAIFKNPYRIIKDKRQRLENLTLRLLGYEKTLQGADNYIVALTAKMRQALTTNIKDTAYNIDRNIERSKMAIKRNIASINQFHKRLDTLLRAYGHEATMQRGFSIVTKDGAVIKDGTTLEIGDSINVRLYRGHLRAIVKEKD